MAAANGIEGLKGKIAGHVYYGIEGPQGPKGDPFRYEDFTEEQLQNLIGPTGPEGPQGEKGNTPVKGQDYYTDAEKEEMKAAVIAALAETLGTKVNVTDIVNNLTTNVINKPLSAAQGVMLRRLIGAAEGEIASLQRDVADLLYEPIAISSISNNLGTVEIGTVVTDITVSWSLNKEPATQTLNGESIDTALRSANVSGTSATVAVTDERDATAQKSTAVTFYNGIYYGAAADPETIDRTFILGLTRVLTGARGRTITVTSGEGQHIWYALPVRLGACKFTVGGFEGGFDLVDTIDFKNASEYTESYYIYRSSQTGLGETKVVVS